MNRDKNWEKRQQQRNRGYETAPVSYSIRRYREPSMVEYCNLRTDRIYELLKKHGIEHNPEAKILDVGCGTGQFINQLASRKIRAKFFGLDFSPKMLSEAEATMREKVTFVHGSAFELPFPNDYFDAITSTRFIHQYSNDHKKLILNEIQRCLKPNGLGIVEFYSSFAWLLRYPFTKNVSAAEHFEHAPTRQTVRELVGEKFDIVLLRIPGAKVITNVLGVNKARRLRGLLEAGKISIAFDEYLAVFKKKGNNHANSYE